MQLSKPVSLWLAPALILALGVMIVLFNLFGWRTSLSGQLFDAWQRHLPLARTVPTVVAVDLPALDEDTMAQAVGALAKAGARAVVLTAPPTPQPSPQRLILKLPPGSDAAKAALSDLPEPGTALVKAAQGLDLVVTADLGHPAVKAKFIYRGNRNPFVRVPPIQAGAGAPDVLAAAAAGVGAANLIPGQDGMIRTVPIAFVRDGALIPSAAAETVRVLQRQPAITVTTDARDPLTFLTGVGIAALQTAKGDVPASRDGAIRLRWGPLLHLSPQQIAAETPKGAVAVIGPAGTGFATPSGPDSLAGVTAHAVATLLSGAAPWRPIWAPLAEALVLALLGLLLLAVLQRNVAWAAVLVVLALPVLFAGGWFVFVHSGLLLDAATPALTLVLALIAGLLAFANQRHLVRTSLRLAFADSLPRATIERIARAPALLTVEGQTRTVTYLVCGVRGLAELAARYREDAAAFTRLMQLVLTPLIDQALAHGGTIDRLTADGFAAFWNAPLDDAQHALHACEAAGGMSIMSSRITEQIAQEAGRSNITPPPIEIGVGLATGQVIAGGFGGYGRMGYSVNGDAVVLAQRIQAQSHQYGPSVIAAGVTRQAADRGFAWLEVDTIAAGAQDPPVTLYALAGNPVMRASPKFRALTVFHDHIFQAIRKQQWSMARQLIAQCRRLSGASGKMYDLHLSRIAWYEKHPPGADWDGAFRPVLE